MPKKDFKLGNMADDLVNLSIEMCGKADDQNPRFPRLLYPTYVDRLMTTALDIQELLIESNEMPKTQGRRC